MNIEDPTSWSKNEFEAYVLLVAASSDLKVVPEEKEAIREKAGDSWNDILNAFRSNSDAESIQLIMANADRFLKTEADHQAMKNEVERLFKSDDDYSSIEFGINSLLKRIL